MLGECQTLLFNLFLQNQTSDMWRWQPDPDKGYFVRDAYRLLTAQELVTLDTAEDLLWHKQVPLKVSSFACGVFCVTGCQQKQIWLLEVLYHQKFTFACTYADVRIGSTFISLMRNFWFFLVASSGLDWLFIGGISHSIGSLRLVYLFSRWSPCATVLYATHLASLRLGGVK
jgi:hypothetical protein